MEPIYGVYFIATVLPLHLNIYIQYTYSTKNGVYSIYPR